MTTCRPYCLSIAGFDPSGGAGILADIKTFEANKVNGMGIITGLTFQNDSEFEGVRWLGEDEIVKQLDTLTRKFQFEYIKIGMIKDLEMLSFLLSRLSASGYRHKIIWDPVIKTSSGFEIQKNLPKEKIIEFCKNIFLITPNIDEIRILADEQDDMKAAKELSAYCHVFLKGGHRPGNGANSKEDKSFGKDYLFTTDGKIFPFRARKISSFAKHGSGCVLSSAITANLAGKEPLLRACLKAKNYITGFMVSNKTLLGYHKI